MKNFPALLVLTALAAHAQWNLMPLPAVIEAKKGTFNATKLSFQITGGDMRVQRAVDEYGQRDATAPNFTIQVLQPGAAVQQLGEDESYTLDVDPGIIRLKAPTSLGALRGLATFAQLRVKGAVPAVHIEDRPRFPWRGLHLDVARHFMPVDVIKRNLDAMAAVKLNVFHWHLSDDQGFRVESKVYPKLHEMGSDGLYYTQVQIKDVVEYARLRGIRVVPEFDIPGHAASWLAGYPELAAAPGPYQIIRTWGIFDPTLDPSNPKVYEFLDGFIGEMTKLFPDAYFHIGGDEVNGKQWKAKGLTNTEAVHAGFNQKLQKIVAKYGKRMEGWDEILSDSLPRNIVIQSWRGQKSLFEAARNGFSGILSAGYYLDHMDTAATMYLVDPLDEKGRASGMLRSTEAKTPPSPPLTEEQRKRILGGEVCMWVEYVSPETVDSRIWPRTAAIAERFWSPEGTKDIADMNRRLDWTSTYLDRFGLKHNTNYQMMLERLAGSNNVAALKNLADVVTPGDLGLRHRMKRDYTQQTPLDRFVDTARPDSPVIRQFNALVEQYFDGGKSPKVRAQIDQWLKLWAANDAILQQMAENRPALAEIKPLSKTFSALAAAALKGGGMRADDALFQTAKQPVAEVRLSVAPALTRLATTP